MRGRTPAARRRSHGHDGMGSALAATGRAPRRGPGRPASSRIRWDKLGRVVLVIVLFVVLASYVNPS